MHYKISYYMKFTNFLWKSALLQKLSAKSTPPPPVPSVLSYLKSGVDYSWFIYNDTAEEWLAPLLRQLNWMQYKTSYYMTSKLCDFEFLPLTNVNPIQPGGGGGEVKPPMKIVNNSWTSEGIKLIFGDFPKT